MNKVSTLSPHRDGGGIDRTGRVAPQRTVSGRAGSHRTATTIALARQSR
jgi:hypothetical protein